MIGLVDRFNRGQERERQISGMPLSGMVPGLVEIKLWGKKTHLVLEFEAPIRLS